MPIVLLRNFELSIDRVLQRTLILSDVRIHKYTLTRGVEMTVAIEKMTLAECLAYDDGTDKLYELENGEPIDITSDSEINRRIAMFLLAYFFQIGIPSYRVRVKTDVVVCRLRTSVRVPDLLVFSEELERVMDGATRSS